MQPATPDVLVELQRLRSFANRSRRTAWRAFQKSRHGEAQRHLDLWRGAMAAMQTLQRRVKGDCHD